MRIYKFTPKHFPLLTYDIAKQILEAINKGMTSIEVSLDLNMSRTMLKLVGDSLLNSNFEFKLEDIKDIVDKGDNTKVYVYLKKGFFALELYLGAFYKIRNVEGSAPTLEINGIHMHRIKDIVPWQDAFLKVKALSLTKRDKVLDIGTGLGYTAIHALHYNPRKIVTVEKDVNVLKLAEYNSWSRGLEKVNIVNEDILDVLDNLEEGYFNKVIHDPPTYKIAEELYSKEFYSKLYELLPRNALVYNYVGNPEEGVKRIRANVLSRCNAAGFKLIKEVNQGFLLLKQ